MFEALKAWRRRRALRRRPFSDGLWRQAIARVSLARRLSPEEQVRLRDLVILFLHEKRFEGVKGLNVGEMMRLEIAIQACVLVLNIGLEAYRGWVSIIVYPGTFLARSRARDEAGLVSDDPLPLAGQAVYRGPVILSWDDVQRGLERPRDGFNPVLHEFAHKLDFLDGAADGAPPLPSAAERAAWKRDFTTAYDDLRARVERGENTVVSEYAATKPAEFFAVVTEAFFEVPERLQKAMPEVYSHLRAFYRQDPASRLRRVGGEPGAARSG